MVDDCRTFLERGTGPVITVTSLRDADTADLWRTQRRLTRESSANVDV